MSLKSQFSRSMDGAAPKKAGARRLSSQRSARQKFALIILAGGVAATALPYRRPDLILKPGMKEVSKVGGIPVASLWGAATSALALIVVILIIAHPEVFGAFTVSSVVTLVLVLGAGPVIYLIARQMRLSQSSIDLRLAMRELPPE